MLRILLLIFLAGVGSVSSAQEKPAWMDLRTREQAYPDDDYFTAFVSRNFRADENVEDVAAKVLSRARQRIGESVYVIISAAAYTSPPNANDESNEYFGKEFITKSALESSGLEYETFVDKENSICYAFTWINKSKVKVNYFMAFQSLMTEIGQDLEDLGEVGDEDYTQLMRIAAKITAAQSQQRVLEYFGARQVALMKPELWVYQDQVAQGTSALKKSEEISLRLAAQFMRDGIVNELGRQGFEINVRPLTYKGTGVPSEFSQLFDRELKASFSQKFELATIEATKEISGTYWPGAKEVKVMIALNEMNDGERIKLLASTSLKVPRELLEKEQVGIVPETRKKLHTIAQLSRGGLDVQVSTQKGSSSLLFSEGEQLEVSVQVSRPAFVQLLNIWPDGSQLLLLDNYYLDGEMVNRRYKLPFAWEAACPCGVEYLYLRAREEPLPPLQTREEDGFQFVETPIEDVLDATRSRLEEEDDSYLGEALLPLTTVSTGAADQ